MINWRSAETQLLCKTIKDWNDLPPGILGIDDYEAFKDQPHSPQKPVKSHECF
jgi:hypothetical protein